MKRCVYDLFATDSVLDPSSVAYSNKLYSYIYQVILQVQKHGITDRVSVLHVGSSGFQSRLRHWIS
jgi:hypothetical protein